MRNRFLFIGIYLQLLLCLPLLVNAESKKTKVACIGNSITYGYSIPVRFQNAYPGILQQMLGKDYDVRNFGISARTLLNKGDYPYMYEPIYREAKAFMPDIVTIKLGTNDSKPFNWKYKKEFQPDLETMIDELKALPSHPEIYLCCPVPSTLPGFTSINDSTIVNGVIPIIKKVAKRKKVHLIDLHTPLEEHMDLFKDKIHPNAEGSAIIAGEIYTALTGEKAPSYDTKQAFPGVKSEWNGYARYDFTCLGRDAIIVAPKKVAVGNPWIWRPAFFGAFPYVDQALLEKGYHVAYYDLTHLYGSPRSVRLGNEFYRIMTEQYHLSSKVVVEGLSRGGYFAFNWAAANPEKVACLYVDAPVCDITSWPGKKQVNLWNDFLKEWNIKDAASGAAFQGNAFAHLKTLAEHQIPIMAVCGDADQVVPYNENLKPFREAYQKLGGTIELVLKPGCDHHPHSLEKPEPIVDFILRYQEGYTDKQHIHFRSNLVNAFSRFQNEKKGCVAFLGGSITEMRGWKEQVQADLRQRFPETDFQFIEAGIGSTGSTPHAFRMEQDVLAKGTPDLLFLEAAVNDATNYFTAEEQVRGMEGIVRHLRNVNPNMDVMFLYFMYDPFIPLLEKDIEPDVIMNHERVANQYYITSINLAREITERMMSKELTWEQFGGVHPSWMGHKYYTAAIARVFDRTAREMSEEPAIHPHPMPTALDPFSYENGHFLDIRNAQKLRGFRYEADWMPKVHKEKVELRNGFHHVPMLESVKEGASFELPFEGKAIGIFCVTGPAAGILDYTIDGKSYQPLDMYTEWSPFLYIPWVYMLATELEDGHHVLKLRVKKGQGKGVECQIRNFVVNVK